MKPYKNFLFFFFILGTLALIMLLFGGQAWYLTESVQIKIPYFSESKKEVKRHKTISTYQMTEVEKMEFLKIDSSALNFIELQDLPYYKFNYDDSLSGPSLASFFNKLASTHDSSESIRILHYGDSQIEGDRITSTIRHYLQQTFGGQGMGTVPLFSPVNVSSYIVDKSAHWEKKTITTHRTENKLSAWMGYLFTNNENPATIRLRISPYVSHPEIRYFSDIQILAKYSQNPDDIKITGISEKTYTYQNQNIGDFFSLIRIPVDTAMRECKITFQNAEDTQIYGVSLDSKQGIQVDNLPQRGSAGYIFSKQKASVLQESFQFLNTGLIILQFGVNAVHNDPRDTVNTKGLEFALRKELTFLRTLLPDIPIIVIGVSDRAYKNGAIYETNPNVLLVRDAQKKAAIRSGCVFWDLFEAMGGIQSIVDWANQKPALAGRDYTHFTAKGAQRVGEMLYKSLMVEYLNYLKKQKEFELTRKLHEQNELS